MDAAAPAGCILSTNTSSISIAKMAAVTSRPELVIGMHFMNPVPVMKLVEIINHPGTSKEVTDNIVALSKDLGKVPCVVNDFPGFISNRILMPMINEAIYCLHEGVAGVTEIDTIMKLGMAHPDGAITTGRPDRAGCLSLYYECITGWIQQSKIYSMSLVG